MGLSRAQARSGYFSVNDAPGPMVVQFDANLFSAQAVQRAAFRLEESFGAQFWQIGETIEVTLTPRGSPTPVDSSAMVETFRRAVLDEQLREQVLDQTREIRQSLIDAAFRAAAAKPRTPSDP